MEEKYERRRNRRYYYGSLAAKRIHCRLPNNFYGKGAQIKLMDGNYFNIGMSVHKKGKSFIVPKLHIRIENQNNAHFNSTGISCRLKSYFLFQCGINFFIYSE